MLANDGFRMTVAALIGLLGVGSLARFSLAPRVAGGLIGALALCELGWYGHSLLQVAPAEQFLGADPVSAALARLAGPSTGNEPVRIKALDNFYGDLPAALHGIHKTNVNDVFQIDHAARLYERLYPVAALRRFERDEVMSQAVQEYHREVRQAVFDRLSVSHVVSDRFESDPGWPVAASGSWESRQFVIQSNPGRMPRAYVVPSAVLAPTGRRFDPGWFRMIDPARHVLMDIDPFSAIAPGSRQPFTRAEWLQDDPDHPVVRVATTAPGLLVVADTWMPGWTALVDGSSVPVLRGNYAQRVIPLVTPGRHTIALHYSPPGFIVGCALTAVSSVVWLILCVAAITGWIRRRRSLPHRLLVHRRFDGSGRRARLSLRA